MTENNNYVEFKKERDLGAIITDTFTFIRYNWKEYFLTILKIAGPVLLLALFSLVGYLMVISDSMQGFMGNANNPDPIGFLKKILPWYGVFIIVFVVLYSLLSLSTLYFIKSYIQSKGNPSFIEVKTNVLKNFWKFLGLGFLITISVLAGYIFCIIPSFYLMVVLSLAGPIMIFKDKSAGDSYGHSFTLIKGEWWNTFGVILVVGILIMLLSSIFFVPSFIYQMIKMSTVISENDPTQIVGVFKDPIYLGLQVISYAFQYMLYSITMIAGVFIYFDLNEQKNLTGTIEKIDSIGSGE